MRHFCIYLILLSCILLIFPGKSYGQLRMPGIPPSIKWDISSDKIPEIMFNAPDIEALSAEDQESPTPFRFAVTIPSDISPDRAGSWVSLPEGGKIWRVTVNLPGALAVSVYFDRFYIPEGGQLFLYNNNKQQVIGAFTSRNNSASGLFATEMVYGDRVTLEYYSPDDNTGSLQLHINEIAYAYRGVDSPAGMNSPSNYAGSCEVNVHCSEGEDWQKQIKGVVRIQVKRSSSLFWCTGSVLNNTRRDHTPYVLTADHCGLYSSDSDLQEWVFYFNYEASGCDNPSIYPTPKSLTGAVLKAHGGGGGSTGSDFFLIRLNQDIPDSFDVFYQGWSRKDTMSPSGVVIHHPEGDLKKISTYRSNLTTTSWNGSGIPSHWKVIWVGTTNGHGVTEGGSSGSPLFDYKGRLVGTLTGGQSSCDSTDLNLPDYFGKFSYSWQSNGTDSTSQLKPWLDPDNTGALKMDGWALSVPEITHQTSLKIFPNPAGDRICISGEDITPGYYSIDIYDVIGELVNTQKKYKDASGDLSVSINNLPGGIYCIRLRNDRWIYTGKIIKK
ncbi:MAG: T9SS type A sorting domain-containing protein [Bacteroidota bacterium]|nr:T9SS type A sorting domain-containing protein [Bacteroidota bacterium]